MASASFSTKITNSIKSGLVIDGLRVEPVALHTSGIGQVQLLDMDFDIRFSEGKCKMLFYTFTSELSIDENLEDFVDFVKLSAHRLIPRPLLPQ